MPTVLTTIPKEKLKLRWEEPYVSEALNLQNGVSGFGIVHGFWPIPAGTPDRTIRLVPLPTFTPGLYPSLRAAAAFSSSRVVSAAVLPSSATRRVGLTYVESAPVVLDLSSFEDEPVMVVLESTYQTLTESSGRIVAYAESEWNTIPADAVTVCVVQVPADPGPITAAEILLLPRASKWRASMPMLDSVAPAGARNTPYVLTEADYNVLVLQDDGRVQLLDTPVTDAPKCLAFDQTSVSGGAVVTFRTKIHVMPGTEILCQWSAEFDNVTADYVGPTALWFDKDGVVLSDTDAIPAAISGPNFSQSYRQYLTSLKAPTDAAFVMLGFKMDNLTVGTAYLESIQFFSYGAHDILDGARPKTFPVTSSRVAWEDETDGAQFVSRVTEDSGDKVLELQGPNDGILRLSGDLRFDVQDNIRGVTIRPSGIFLSEPALRHIVKVGYGFEHCETFLERVTPTYTNFSASILATNTLPDTCSYIVAFPVDIEVGAFIDRIQIPVKWDAETTPGLADAAVELRLLRVNANNNAVPTADSVVSTVTVTRAGDGSDANQTVLVEIEDTEPGSLTGDDKAHYLGLRPYTVELVITNMQNGNFVVLGPLTVVIGNTTFKSL